jgi:hypothetical protein
MGDDAGGLALQALRQFKARNFEEGASLYRRALKMPDGAAVPICRHLRLLAGSGLSDAAAIVERIALREGADLSSGPTANRGNPQNAVAEYEALFARGTVNARMMANYVAALSLAGASAKLAAANDPATLFRRTTLRVDAPLEPFLARVADSLLRAQTREFETARKSLREIDRVRRANTLDDPALVALHRAVRDQVADYIADVAASGHMIASWLSSRFSLQSWGVISQGAGYSAPHIHGGCWVVAVAYIVGEAPAPGDGPAGTMRIGPTEEGDPACDGWPDITVAPIPGTLVIMPAFYTHWTVPLARPGLRISVAFNADEPAQEASG